MYPILLALLDIPVYPFAVEAWKLAARMGEKEDWSLVRVLINSTRPRLFFSLRVLYTRPKAWQAIPSQAKRGQGIACPGSILTTVKRKKEGEDKERLMWSGFEWFGGEERGGVRVQIK